MTTETNPETMTRDELIAWLEQNDPNGCYSDADMLAEFGEVAETSDLRAIVLEQQAIEPPSYFDLPKALLNLWADVSSAEDRGDYKAAGRIQDEALSMEADFRRRWFARADR